MQAIHFQVLRTSDACQKIRLTFLSGDNRDFKPDEFDGNEDLARIINDHVRVFGRAYFDSSLGAIAIRRHTEGKAQNDNAMPFDEVTVSPANNDVDPLGFAQFVAFAQSHLGKAKITALESYLGDEARLHFQARDVALARLETLVAQLSRDLEDVRQKREEELHQKDVQLEAKFQTKEQELNDQAKKREAQLDERENGLDEREKSLNLQEPKTERRQVFQESKNTLIVGD